MEQEMNKKVEPKKEETRASKGKVWMWIWIISMVVFVLSVTGIFGPFTGIPVVLSILVGGISFLVWALKSKTGRKILLAMILLLGLFFFVYLLIARPHKMGGGSMMPNFRDSEYLLTEKVTYYTSSPKRGDVIVFTPPVSITDEFISRVIGLPGEKIMFKDGRVYINDKILNESYLENTVITYGGPFLSDNVEYTIPTNQYFVMGDYRMGSSDSRFWGPITKSVISGRAWIIYWPRSLSGVVPKPNYSL